MTGYTYGRCKQPITPADPWPTDRTKNGVHLHHPILDSLLVHSWEDGLLQLERLDALARWGYRRRDEGLTDADFIRHAQELTNDSPVIDHPYYFRHEDDSVIIFHTYAPEEQAYCVLPQLCEGLSDVWRRDITFEIDERFNFYWPTSSGVGYEIRRPMRVRGPRRLGGYVMGRV